MFVNRPDVLAENLAEELPHRGAQKGEGNPDVRAIASNVDCKKREGRADTAFAYALRSATGVRQTRLLPR